MMMMMMMEEFPIISCPKARELICNLLGSSAIYYSTYYYIYSLIPRFQGILLDALQLLVPGVEALVPGIERRLNLFESQAVDLDLMYLTIVVNSFTDALKRIPLTTAASDDLCISCPLHDA